MDKALIAQSVANKLFATEDAVDTAMIEATKLLSGIVEARHEMRVSAVVVDEVIAKLAPTDGVEEVHVVDEDEYFPPPRELRDFMRKLTTALTVILDVDHESTSPLEQDARVTASDTLYQLR